MKHRANRRTRLAILAAQLRRIQCARNDFMMRWMVESLIIGPLLLDPLLGALGAASIDGASWAADSLQGDAPADDTRN
jgi:hypothetical protein